MNRYDGIKKHESDPKSTCTEHFTHNERESLAIHHFIIRTEGKIFTGGVITMCIVHRIGNNRQGEWASEWRCCVERRKKSIFYFILLKWFLSIARFCSLPLYLTAFFSHRCRCVANVNGFNGDLIFVAHCCLEQSVWIYTHMGREHWQWVYVISLYSHQKLNFTTSCDMWTLVCVYELVSRLRKTEGVMKR